MSEDSDICHVIMYEDDKDGTRPKSFPVESLIDILQKFRGSTVDVYASMGYGVLSVNKAQSEDSDITQIKLPTDEQVERAAIAMAIAAGYDVERGVVPRVDPMSGDDASMYFPKKKDVYAEFLRDAKMHLTILLNKDRILGYGRL